MRVEGASGFDWRDSAAYARLLGADRSLIAWEWLRRDSGYRAAADAILSGGGRSLAEDQSAAAFGLLAFEPPHLAVPDARPVWRRDVHPAVLAVDRCPITRPEDAFPLDRLHEPATLVAADGTEHLLLCDGQRTIRLDAPRETFGAKPLCLRYRLEGLVTAQPQVLTLRRLLALCRAGRFSRTLHPREPRASRWILMLRAWDALAAGEDQRRIAEELLSRSVAEPGWRSRESSIRSQAQRLVRSARHMASGGYRRLLL